MLTINSHFSFTLLIGYDFVCERKRAKLIWWINRTDYEFIKFSYQIRLLKHQNLTFWYIMLTLVEWLISSYLVIAVVINGLHCLGGFFNAFHIESRFLLCERLSLAWQMKLPLDWRKSLCEAGITLVFRICKNPCASHQGVHPLRNGFPR